jgi:Predicted permease
MKLEPHNENYLTVAAYALICALIISLFAVAVFNLDSVGGAFRWLWNILKPIGYGIFLAGIIYTPEKFLEEKLFSFLDRKPPAPSVRFSKSLGRFIWRIRSRTHRNRRFKRGCALAFTYILILAALTGFILIVVPQVAQSYSELADVAPGYLRSAQRWLDKVLVNIPFGNISTGINIPGTKTPTTEELTGLTKISNPFVLTVHDAQTNAVYNLVKQVRAGGITIDLSDALNKGLAAAMNLMSGAMPQILDFIGTIVTEVKNIAFGLVISVYLLASREKLLAQVKKYMSSLLPRRVVNVFAKVGRITAVTFAEYVTGKILDATVIGILCTVSMLIFRIPYAPLIGLLVGVTNVIPFLGPFLGAVPGSIIIFIVNPIKSVWFILLIIVLQQLDSNFIEPYIVGDKTGLASVYIITSVITMGGIFGIPGLFLGVPSFAVFYALVKDWSEERLAKKSLPTETIAYAKGAEISAVTAEKN